MRKKISLLALICVIALSALISLPNDAQAIGVSPTIFDEINVDPGGVVQFDFRILSDYNEDKTIYFSTQNFVAGDGEEGKPKWLEEDMSPSADLASWITVIQDSVLLPARKEASANAIINVPGNAEPGGHYAVIWATETEPDEAGTVSVTGNVGVLVLVNVSGDIQEKGNVLEFRYLKKFQNRLPVDFVTRISNEGNVYFKPRGNIVIKGLFGNEAGKTNANPKGSNILPNSIRRIDGARWIKSNDMKEGGFITELKNEWKNFAIGPYKAYLDVSTGQEARVTAKTKYFWVIPWRVLLVVFVILLIIYLILKLYNRSIVKMAKNEFVKTEKKEAASPASADSAIEKDNKEKEE